MTLIRCLPTECNLFWNKICQNNGEWNQDCESFFLYDFSELYFIYIIPISTLSISVITRLFWNYLSAFWTILWLLLSGPFAYFIKTVGRVVSSLYQQTFFVHESVLQHVYIFLMWKFRLNTVTWYKMIFNT